MELATKQDFLAFKEEMLTKLNRLENLFSGQKPSGGWMKSTEFMREFRIDSKETLQKYRIQGLVKAQQKGRIWYYNSESFLK